VFVLADCGGTSDTGTATPGATPAPTTATQDAQPTSTITTETGDESTTTAEQPTDEYSITITNGSLPDGVDPNRTFARVQSLLESDVRPQTVEIRNLSEWRQGLPRIAASPLNRALGYENASVNWSQPTGVTRPTTGYVYIHPGNGKAGQTDRVLAHEFVHTIQFRSGMLPWLNDLNQPRVTSDLIVTRLALVEGGAVFVADAYTDRYLDVRNNSAFVSDLYETRSPAYRNALARYYFGHQYIDRRIDSPSELESAYQNYPQTSEQLLHNETRDAEPPANLTLSTNTTDSDWQYQTNDTVGELSTRIHLSTELDRQRAADAAAGWGLDELRLYEHVRTQSRYGWAWVHRWDDESEADEARAALRDFASQRRDDSNLDFEAVRVSDETTALVFGDQEFVDATTVDGSTANVTVSVGS
jgi:hypothetical protein